LCPKKLICHVPVGGGRETKEDPSFLKRGGGDFKGTASQNTGRNTSTVLLLVVILIAMSSLLRLKLHTGISENGYWNVPTNLVFFSWKKRNKNILDLKNKAIKNFFNLQRMQENCFAVAGCFYRIQMIFSIPNPGPRGQKSTGIEVF
jgi:hypothetical protein